MQLEKMARKFQKSQTDLNREVPTIRNQILNKINKYFFSKMYHWSDTIESKWTLKYYVLNLTVKKILAKNFC